MKARRYVRVGAGLILGLCAFGSGQAAQVASYWVDGSSHWNISGNGSNAAGLGGFPNNGNASVATYDAVINSGIANQNKFG